MAVRRVTHRYGSVVDFLEDHQGILGQGALLLPPDAARGELAAELKLDLLIPPLGRLGPIPAQVVNRAADGSVALRIAEWPVAVQARIDELLVAVADLRQWFLDSGQLAVAGQAGSADAARPATAAGAAPQLNTLSGDSQVSDGALSARGFAVPDLSSVAPDLSGDCEPKTLRKILVDLAIEKKTGLLTIQQPGGRTRYGFWSAGGPVGWRTDPLVEGEVMGVLLAKAEQISPDQLRESLKIMQRTGCRQGDAFIEMGAMNFAQLVMVLGKQVEFITQRVLLENDGTWTFHSLNQLPERFLPVPLRAPGLVFRALFQQARGMKGNALFRSLGRYLDQYLLIPQKFANIIPELRFSPAETKLVETIQSGSWRLRELYAVSPMSRAVTAAVMWAMIELNFVSFRATQDESRVFAQLQVIIDRKKAQVYKGNHFDVLEVHWICLTDEVEAAYRRLKEEFEPSRFAPLGATAVTEITRINAQLDESRQVLCDETQRREYRKAVVEQAKILDSASLLGQQGEMAILRHDRRAAVTCYAKATELVPGHPEYRGGLVRARSIGG
ncbi:MAG: J domain-containing protein [Oligoflexia bacterium]|nr:J domain-containing protein [Oligoflexia bacterium]